MRVSLRQVNNGLLVLIILCNLYVIAAPFAPAVLFWWQNNHTDRRQTLSAQIHQPAQPHPATNPTNQPNHLIIPSMLLDSPVLESPMATVENTLNHGVVHLPIGSTPDKGGNTILIGHRFSYTAPKGIFYFLNKVQVDDEIGLVWNNKTYTYKVASVRQVRPTETSVEAPTADARLTLYTCTPLWNPKDRLVVVAELEGKSG